MSAALLDVNALVALAWPNHIHHQLAHAWFETTHQDGWATCPLTQSGFVRVSSNPRTTSEAVTPTEAINLLSRLIQVIGHEFWRDDYSIVADMAVDPIRLIGYRQVTDLHLLGLAHQHDGRLATLDRGIRDLAGADLEHRVELLS